jgi:hypothetical protein
VTEILRVGIWVVSAVVAVAVVAVGRMGGVGARRYCAIDLASESVVRERAW